MLAIKAFIFLSAMAWLMMLAGCAYPDMHKKPPSRNLLRDAMVHTERPPMHIPPRIDRLNERAAALSALDEQSPQDYIVGPSDVLSIKVMLAGEDKPDLELVVAVDTLGYLRCPQLGQVKVEGLSVEQISRHLFALYEDGYYRYHTVTVSVLEHYNRRATITGLVENPGNYPIFGEKKSLFHLLVDAGGLAKGAGTTAIVTRANNRPDNELLRAANDRPAMSPRGNAEYPGSYTVGNFAPESVVDADPAVASPTPLIKRVDIEELARQGNIAYNIWIYPGDIVHVQPEKPAKFVYVTGFVRKPGAYELPRHSYTTLGAVIARAGGPTEVGRAQYTYLVRHEGGEPTIYKIDLARITNAQEPDIPLRPNDRIILGTDWIRRSIDGVLNVTGLRFLIPNY